MEFNFVSNSKTADFLVEFGNRLSFIFFWFAIRVLVVFFQIASTSVRKKCIVFYISTVFYLLILTSRHIRIGQFICFPTDFSATECWSDFLATLRKTINCRTQKVQFPLFEPICFLQQQNKENFFFLNWNQIEMEHICFLQQQNKENFFTWIEIK